jgi:hypothetical protein
MRKDVCACAVLALVASAGADRARAGDREKDRQEATEKGLERLNKQMGITTDGPRVGPGTSARDLGAKWADALSTGNRRGLLDLIEKDWWARCATPEARVAEHGRGQAVAGTLGSLAAELPRGVKLTKTESLSREKRIAKGEELDGCVADHDLIVQRWRFEVRKGKGKPTGQEYEVIAVDGKWFLRAP